MTVRASATATPGPDRTTPASRWQVATVAVALTALTFTTGLAVPAQAAGDAAVRVVVLWEPGTPEATRATVLTGLGERGEPVGALDTVTVGATHTAGVAASLHARADVVAAEPDRPILLTAGPAPRPSDPLFGSQWGLENVGQLRLADGAPSTPGVDVRARSAWKITRGVPQVTVAVIDSAVDVAHPDLKAAIWTNPLERADGVDRDRNGFVDDVNGWDFIEHRPIRVAAPHVAERHGTQVAGVIAARSGDGFGISGIAPLVSIMPVRAFDEASTTAGPGGSDLSTIVTALTYAADNGADIINASWESTTRSRLLEEVVAGVGVPVVAASGNRALDLEVSGVAVPAGYRLPNVIGVTAIDARGGLAGFANVGASTIDLGAPGVAIVTTDAGGGHTTLDTRPVSGTSFAAPLVSGALALGLSAHPATPQADLLDTLRRTTRAERSLAGRTTTGGSLDAAAFVAGLDRPVCGREGLPVAGFGDVASTSTHTRAIDCIADADVTRGYPDGTFRPARTVTRGQLASFLAGVVRASGGLPVDPPDAFSDDDGSVHEPAINALAALGILAGDDSGRVRANATVTRGQLAALLTRTHEVIDGTARTPSRTWFEDVVGSTHADAIHVARDLGLVRGRTVGSFDAAAGTRRDQMASSLARTLDSLARAGTLGSGADSG